jgi:Alpha/beta hydrolase family
MSVFCLVHGSGQGPKGWDLLVVELDARGHHCVCVDLPTDQPAASATVYAGVIAKALENVDEPIVVAHSVSGLFLPLVPSYAGCQAGLSCRRDTAARRKLPIPDSILSRDSHGAVPAPVDNDP